MGRDDREENNTKRIYGRAMALLGCCVAGEQWQPGLGHHILVTKRILYERRWGDAARMRKTKLTGEDEKRKKENTMENWCGYKSFLFFYILIFYVFKNEDVWK
jgi:hypothetical protein